MFSWAWGANAAESRKRARLCLRPNGSARILSSICRARKNRCPLGDDLTIPLSDWPFATPQIVESHRMQIVALDTQSMLPVDLVGERVPRETIHRDARRAELDNVGPLPVEPRDRLRAHAIRLAVKQRDPVSS